MPSERNTLVFGGSVLLKSYRKEYRSLFPTDMTAVTPLNTVTQFDRSSQLLSDFKYRLLESNLCPSTLSCVACGFHSSV